jgi:hypothetical protein
MERTCLISIGEEPHGSLRIISQPVHDSFLSLPGLEFSVPFLGTGYHFVSVSHEDDETRGKLSDKMFATRLLIRVGPQGSRDRARLTKWLRPTFRSVVKVAGSFLFL